MRATIVESIVLLLLGLALASVVFESIDRRRGAAIGAADAERDLAAGRIGLKGLGKPMYWTRDYKELLANQYGVEYEHVAACCPTSFQIAYIASYNTEMKPYWDQKELDLDRIRSDAIAIASARVR